MGDRGGTEDSNKPAEALACRMTAEMLEAAADELDDSKLDDDALVWFQKTSGGKVELESFIVAVRQLRWEMHVRGKAETTAN